MLRSFWIGWVVAVGNGFFENEIIISTWCEGWCFGDPFTQQCLIMFYRLFPPTSLHQEVGNIAWWPKIATFVDSHPKFFPAMAWKLPYRLIFARCPLNVTMCFSGNPSGALHASFCTMSLKKWQRRSDRLESLLRRVRCPRVESFEAKGRVYQLPVSVAMPKGQLSQEELEYLCGNFDGDGCVSMQKTKGRMMLSVTQALERADILIRFRDAVGGCIYRHSDATGFRSASLLWRAQGPAAQHAASILARLPSMKKAQLNIAAQAVRGIVDVDSRLNVAGKLALLKAHTYEPPQGALKCTWSYFAGFFDAEGCIAVRPDRPSIILSVGQTNPHVLQCLLSFLHQEGFQQWKLYRNHQGHSFLTCEHLPTAKSCLGRLLVNGLTLKRSQAEASLTLTATNHYEIRDLVSQLNGRQRFYQRLDEAGIGKAKEIQRQQDKIRRLRERSRREDHNTASLEVAEAELQKLEEERALCKVMSRCNKLRSQVRKSLREGATILPPHEV